MYQNQLDLSKIKEVYYESFNSVKQRDFSVVDFNWSHRDDLQIFR